MRRVDRWRGVIRAVLLAVSGVVWPFLSEQAQAQAPGRTFEKGRVPAPTPDDAAAGVTALDFPWRGARRFITVPGELPAPGNGVIQRVRVEVESGLEVDLERFAAFVLDTLNDPRSWGRDGDMTFARTASAEDADLTVTLASPGTVARLCLPFVTGGFLSCGQPKRAILTMYRWVRGVEYFGEEMTPYRQYLVNHEVGHVLGHDHANCPRRGAFAPVMQQQTKGLRGCRPNAWPYREP